MASFGKRAAELIKEVALLDPCSLPPYADALMSVSKEEAMEHYRALLAALSALQARSEGGAAAAQPEDAAAVMVHNRALLRNKRLMLAYVNARMARVKALRWTVGSGLPEELATCMSSHERDFFKAYNQLLGTYMGASGVGLNLTLDPSPPKQQRLEVRVLAVDYGTLYTRDGELQLNKGSTHYMWRDEAQPLIAEGVLEKVVDG